MGLARWMSDFQGSLEVEHHSAAVDGHEMHYWRAGTGPDLLILHGLLGTAAAWEDMAPRLAPDSTVYAIDALGIGRSERPPGIDSGLEAQADRVAQFMAAVGIPTADILATSHGGAVALMLAAKHPARVRTLILNAPANPFSDWSDSLIRFYQSPLGRWFAHRIPYLPEPVTAVALGRMYGDEKAAQNGELKRYMDSLRIPGTVDYVLSILSRWFEDMHSLESALERVRSFPALLVWGDQDRAVSLESGRRLQRFFDHSELIPLPGTGHLPSEECPGIFAHAINTFLIRSRAEREIGPKLVRKSGPAA
ncbi:MAG TPA: alpha/beta hydrolase [Acidobacteriaceae bacterium]|jgi:pimeloyl-ACP methyl ester carboxylesterase